MEQPNAQPGPAILGLIGCSVWQPLLSQRDNRPMQCISGDLTRSSAYSPVLPGLERQCPFPADLSRPGRLAWHETLRILGGRPRPRVLHAQLFRTLPGRMGNWHAPTQKRRSSSGYRHRQHSLVDVTDLDIATSAPSCSILETCLRKYTIPFSCALSTPWRCLCPPGPRYTALL